MFNWLSGRDAARVGAALADDVVLQTAPGSDGPSREKRGSQGQELQKLLQKFLLRVDHETGALKLNIFKRATLANSFKWRLLEKGVEQNVVEELTQALVLRLTTSQPEPPVQQPVAAVKGRLGRDEVQTL